MTEFKIPEHFRTDVFVPEETPVNEPDVLEPIVYERILNAEGKVVGYHVPDHERERWNRGSGRGTSNSLTPPPLSLESIMVRLEKHLLIDDRMKSWIEQAYAKSPEKVTRLTQIVVDKTEAAELKSPEGFLAHHLKGMI